MDPKKIPEFKMLTPKK